MKYAIWCEVSGGITGTRETWMKKDGNRVEFQTAQEAQTECDKWNKKFNGPHATALFRYTVQPIAR